MSAPAGSSSSSSDASLRHPPAMSPLREVWSIAWPTVITMTSYTVMQFADSLMVGQVGPLELAAQGNGQIWSFAPIAFAMGMLTVVNTYVSQNLGAGRPEEGPKYAWAALWLSVAVWLALLLPWGAAMPLFFGSMDHAPRLMEMEVGYGRIMIAGSVLLLAGRGLHHYFFGLHRPKVVTIAAIVGNITNVALNYVLIFGEHGLPALGLPGVPGVPALGVYGAAIATVCGSAVELLIPAAIFFGPRMNRELHSRSQWRPQWKPIRDLIRIGWPASIQFGNELLCWAIFMTVLVGKFGADHMTAGWIAFRYMHVSFMPAVGFSVATTSLVGKYIGAGKPDIAAARARLALRCAVGYMTVCALAFFFLRYPLVSLFIGQDTDPARAAHVLSIGTKLLICAAIFQTVDAFGIIYTGALRGAGDTIWPGVMTVAYSWSLIVGGGAAMMWLWPGLESIGPWIGATAYIIAYGITMAVRFETGRWRSIRLIDRPGADAALAAEPGLAMIAGGEALEAAAHSAPVFPGAAESAGSSVRDLAPNLAEATSARQ